MPETIPNTSPDLASDSSLESLQAPRAIQISVYEPYQALGHEVAKYVERLGLKDTLNEKLRENLFYRALNNALAKTDEISPEDPWLRIMVVREFTILLRDKLRHGIDQALKSVDPGRQGALHDLIRPAQGAAAEVLFDPSQWIPDPHPAQNRQEYLVALYHVCERMSAQKLAAKLVMAES